MSITDVFKTAGRQLSNQLLPTSRLDPVSILTRVLGYKSSDPSAWAPSGTSGRDVLTSMRGRGDPLLNFNWYCELPVLDNNVSLGWEFVEEVTTPFVEFEQISNYRAGKMYHYPGHYSVATLSLKLFENSRGVSTQYINAWQSLILSPMTGTYNNPADYKKPIKITVFDVAKLTAMFLTYEKCWPMRTDAYSLQSNTSDRINPTLELSADDVFLEVATYEAGAIPSIIDNASGARTLERQTQILKDSAIRVLSSGSIFDR